MLLYTAIVSVKNTGRIIIGNTYEVETPQEAIHGLLKGNGILEREIADVIVLKGLVGGAVLHRSEGLTPATVDQHVEDMQAAFDLVKPEDDWKGPIDKVITEPSSEKLRLICKAIAEITGSQATCEPAGKNKIRIRADGYYNATVT